MDEPAAKAASKTPLIAVAAVLAVLILIIGAVFALKGSGEPTASRPADSRYIDWDEAAFTDHTDDQRWLYFHADWCPNCRALNADIEANLDDIPTDVIIFKVDYDDNQDLKERYGVNRQTTVVSVDENGEQLESFLAVGSETLAALVERLYIEPPVAEVEEMPDSGNVMPDDAPSSDQNPGSTGSEQAPADSQDETEPTDEEQTAPEPPNPRYVEWSEAAFAEHASRQRWLNFHADWCPNCRALDANIRANLDDIPSDVVIFKVDYDDNQALRQQYGVNRQTTVVSVDGSGEKIKSFLAVNSETLAALIGELY